MTVPRCVLAKLSRWADQPEQRAMNTAADPIARDILTKPLRENASLPGQLRQAMQKTALMTPQPASIGFTFSGVVAFSGATAMPQGYQTALDRTATF